MSNKLTADAIIVIDIAVPSIISTGSRCYPSVAASRVNGAKKSGLSNGRKCEFHPPVQLPTCLGRVVRDRLCFPKADAREASAGNTL